VIKRFVRAAFRRAGMDLRRCTLESAADLQLKAMLQEHAIDLVLDVGANTGQFARELRDGGYGGRIVSFEPLGSAYRELQAAAANDPGWEIAPRMAIGATEGEIRINVSRNSVSSSILPILGAHTDAAPGSAVVSQDVARLAPLDAVANDFIRADSRVFLKIDTQGYESEVLKGARQTLARALGVQLELSLVPLYDGQALLPELWEAMTQAGFDLWAMSPVFVDPKTGRLLQVDATFFRKRL
jgi:FkbM family methyltransferase